MSKLVPMASPLSFSALFLFGFLIILISFIVLLYLILYFKTKVKKQKFNFKPIFPAFISTVVIDLLVIIFSLINRVFLEKIKSNGGDSLILVDKLNLIYLLIPSAFMIIGPAIFTYFYIKGVPKWKIFPKQITG